MRRWLIAGMLLVGAVGISGPRPVWAQHTQVGPEEQFAEAFGLYASKFYLRAAESFERFLSSYPNHPSAPEALYYQAQATLGAGLDDEATQLFITFRERYPVHPLAFQARLALGKYFYEGKQYERTIQTLQGVVDEEPPPEVASRALYWMGESAMQLERFDEGMDYFRQAAEDYRNTTTAPLAQYAIGYAYAQQNNPAEAARSFETLAIRYPDSPYANRIGLSLAESYYELGDYQRAIEELRKRLPQLEGDAEQRATFLLAESYNQLGNHERAIIYYRRFTEDNPGSRYYRQALYGLAWNYYFERAYEQASRTFQQVYEDPADDELSMRARYYRAVNLKLTGRGEEAARLFEEVVARWPESELADRAQFELGMTLYDMRRWQEAERAFAAIEANYPASETLGEALRMKGEAQVAQGDFTAAQQAYDASIELDAASTDLRTQVAFQRAWLLYRTEKYAEAGPAFFDLYQADTDGDGAGEALFWAAESFYQIDDYDRAELLFSQFLSRFRGHKQRSAAHYALGWTYFRQERYASAIQQFERFLQGDAQATDPQYVLDARLRLADSYYALKRYDDAIREYARVEGDYVDYALFQRGQALAQTRRNDQAIETLQELIDNYSYSEWREETLYTIGFLQLSGEEYEAAVRTFETLVRRFPDHPLAVKGQYGIGDAYYNNGQLEEAVEAYQKVLDQFPDSPYVIDAFGSMSYALTALDRPDELEPVIEDFASRNPNSPVVDQLRFRQAEVKFQSGQLEDAITSFQEFIQESSSSTLVPAAYYYVGRAYNDLGQKRDAETYLKQVVDRYPSSPLWAEAEQQLGRLYLEDERYDEALQLYDRALQNEQATEANFADAQYGKGMALLGLDRIDEAAALLEEALAAVPEGPASLPTKMGLGRVYEQQDRMPTAIRYYREVAEGSPDELGAEALYRLGALFIEIDQPYPALEELGRLEVLFPGFDDWIARGYLAQARAYRQLGQAGNADSMYETVITQYPGTPFAEEAERERRALVN